jgi:hypothetical protein
MNNRREGQQRPDEESEWGAGTGRETNSLVRLFGQMMMLPFTVFVYGMDVFVKTVQGMQRTTDEGMDVVLGGAARAPRESGATTQTPGEAPGGQGETESSLAISSTDCVVEGDAQTNPKETKNMNDTDLSDDKVLKLVRYKIIFIKRDYEVAFPEVEELVSDSLTDTGYTAWKIAEFIQRLNETPVPKKKWGGGTDSKEKPKYPPAAKFDPNAGKNGEWVIQSLPEDDKKYLRVYFEVLDRYDREHFKYEERQIEVLEDIRDALSTKP